MRQKFSIIVNIFVCAFILSGCISVARSPSPRFYRLRSLSSQQAVERIKIPADTLIGVGPVKIPGYLDRPQIVTVNKDQTMAFAQFDRWGESLDLAMARVLDENLTFLLEGSDVQMHPWNMFVPVRFQVTLEVIRMDIDLEKDVELVVQWTMLDIKDKNFVFSQRSVLRVAVEPSNYSGAEHAISTALSKLSSEIAHELSRLLAEHQEKKQHMIAI